MIKSEEEFLGLKYGEEYEKYRGAVPRIIKLF
jgi:protein-S-isoprenylcysteine O-methyltransferase Ste14